MSQHSAVACTHAASKNIASAVQYAETTVMEVFDMSNHRPDIYTEQLWAARHLKEYYGGASVWGVVVWALILIVTIGFIGSWFIPV